MRNVGKESKVTYQDKILSGFFARYMYGQGIDIGYRGTDSTAETILPGAQGVDIGTPGYDGFLLPYKSDTLDYVYSSHCLEHLEAPIASIREWFRVVKPHGHLVIVVPHQYLYEKRSELPSRWNRDHKTFYTPAKLMLQVELALTPNTYRLRLLEDGDKNFDYSLGPERHSSGQYEITCVLQKIIKPRWDVE